MKRILSILMLGVCLILPALAVPLTLNFQGKFDPKPAIDSEIKFYIFESNWPGETYSFTNDANADNKTGKIFGDDTT